MTYRLQYYQKLKLSFGSHELREYIYLDAVKQSDYDEWGLATP